MKKRRIGSFSMGLFLIFLGAALLLGQFEREAARMLLRNWWPLFVMALGVELLLCNHLLNKYETKFSFDVLSALFAGLIGLASLGVYALESAGVWDRLSELAGGRNYRVEHRMSLIPRGSVEKIFLDGSGFKEGTIHLWDSPDERVIVRVGGRVYGGAARRCSGGELAPAVTLEQIGRIINVRLHRLRADAPWNPRPDVIDVLVPPRCRVEYAAAGNLEVRTFHGATSGPQGNDALSRSPALVLPRTRDYMAGGANRRPRRET